MPALGKGKRFLFSVFALLCVVVTIEIGMVAVHYVIKREPFPRLQYQKEMVRVGDPKNYDRPYQHIMGEVNTAQVRVESLHPYVGFALDPKRSSEVEGVKVSQFGFIGGQDDLLVRRSPTKLNVGIFGGSFALGVFLTAREHLASALRPIREETNIMNFAYYGYKQPQQMLALGYSFSLGTEFDIVINLDGFNETAVAMGDNFPNRVFPVYPTHWGRRTLSASDPYLAHILDGWQSWEKRRRMWASLLLCCRLDGTAAGCTVWSLGDRLIRGRITAARKSAADRYRTAARNFFSNGPEFDMTNERAYEYLASHWKRSSLAMDGICSAHGARYYHFLQPNQYNSGSKHMSPDEVKIAVNEGQPYRSSVIQGFPLLRLQGKELVDKGVRFHDLTMVFANITDSAYADDCCHATPDGYGIVAREIGRIIVQDFLRPGAGRNPSGDPAGGRP